MMDRVFLKDMVFFARHGLFEEEARLGQRFEVDVDCLYVTGPSSPGGATAVADYAEVFEEVKRTVEGERMRFIERLAERVAEALLARFPAIAEVRVEVRKPSAPIPGVFGTVGVEIRRRRGDGA